MAASPVTSHDETVQMLPPTREHASGWSLFWSGIGFALLLLLMGLVTYWFVSRTWSDVLETDVKRVEFRAKTLADRNTEDHKLLYDAPSWQDKAKGVVRVPIEQAVALTIAELKKTQPHPAYPLTQSPPQPAAAPTSPDKGGGTSAPGNNAVNPPSSNPTVGGAPVPAAPAASPAAPANTPAPSSPTASPAAPAPTAAPQATPPAGTRPVDATNNANNPGAPPVPGTNVQPPAPTAGPMPTAAETPPATPTPTPAPTPTPSPTSATGDSTPSPTGPGTSPTGTP